MQCLLLNFISSCWPNVIRTQTQNFVTFCWREQNILLKYVKETVESHWGVLVGWFVFFGNLETHFETVYKTMKQNKNYIVIKAQCKPKSETFKYEPPIASRWQKHESYWEIMRCVYIWAACVSFSKHIPKRKWHKATCN